MFIMEKPSKSKRIKDFAKRHKYKIGGALAAAGLAAAAVRQDFGHTYEYVLSANGGKMVDSSLNPFLHYITYALGEGVKRIPYHEISSNAVRSAIINLPAYITEGQVASFLTSKVVKKVKK
jgi:DNA topoisomerase IA